MTEKGPRLLLWVTDLKHFEDRHVNELVGCEFLYSCEGGFDTELLEELFAITLKGNIRISNPGLCLSHIHNKGWHWYISDTTQLPDRPFLLTDDASFNLIFDGEVLLEPTEETKESIPGEWEFYGEAVFFLVSATWIAELTVMPPSFERGRLLAFSNRCRQPLQAREEATDAIHEMLFGTIVFLNVDGPSF